MYISPELTSSQSAWNKIVLLTLFKGAHEANPTPVDNFAIQKLTFVAELNGRRKGVHSAYFKFYRYNQGPFSSMVANEVRYIESLGLIDPESREVTKRGAFLLEYLEPEVAASATAKASLVAIEKAINSWGQLRSWNIVNPVYDLKVPVDGRDGEEMFVRDIPMHTDIIVPWRFKAAEAIEFSTQTLEDIDTELSIPASELDADNPALIQSVFDGLQMAFAA